MKTMLKLLTLNQKELHELVKKEALKKNMPMQEKENAWLLINYHPNYPLLVAHLDTVRQTPLKKEDLIINEPIIKARDGVLGGDDRCGVWIILKLIRMKAKYSYLLCWDEEIGCIGSSLFPIEKYKFSCLIGLDRRGATDCALYGHENSTLIKIFKDRGFFPVDGSITDVAILAEKSQLACVNLSVGFFNEHTAEEFINLNFTKNTLNIISQKDLITELHKEIYFAEYPIWDSYSDEMLYSDWLDF